MRQFDELLRGSTRNKTADDADGVDDEDDETEQQRSKPDSNMDWRELSKHRKKKAGLFTCLGDLLERLVAVQLFTILSSRIVAAQLELSGEDFELQQRRRAAYQQTRTFRVLETAFGRVLGKAMREAQHLLFSIPYAFGPNNSTYTARSFLFRMVSAFICSLESTAGRYHRIFPYMLFKVLLGIDSARKVYRMRHCVRDELATSFFEAYPNPEDSQSSDAKCFLQTLALMVDVDIASLECGHSSIREQSRQRARGHIPTLPQISAQVLSRFIASKHSHELNRPKGRNDPEQPEPNDSTDEVPTRVKRTGAGGAYRAFISEHAKGKRLHANLLKDLTLKYNALTYDEKQVYREKGALMTMVKRYERIRGVSLQESGQNGNQDQDSNAQLVEANHALSSAELLQLKGDNPDEALMRLGNNFAERHLVFSQIVKRELKQHHAVRESSLSLPEGISLYTEAVESESSRDLARGLLHEGGPAFLSGLVQTPGPCGSSGGSLIDMQHFEWRMPIVPLVKDVSLEHERRVNKAL